MKTYGITGGMGMGKSTAAQILCQRGVAVVDTDDLARDVVQPGEPALTEIQTAFGRDLVAADGRLKRDALAAIVFADATARERIEAILHPRIQQRWQTQLQTWRDQGLAVAAVIIPLLFETGAESLFDTVVCVACSPTTQRQRLAGRGWTPEHIEQRLAAQMPVVEKMSRAQHVIWSEGALEAHAQQWDRILGPN
jgi:dephospho-CoA kinase